MTDRCRAVRGGRAGTRVEELSDSGQLTNNNPRRLVVTALVPPRPALDPPAILALVVEKHTTPSAHVVFQLYGEVLLHTHLDCAAPPLVPGRTGLFLCFCGFCWANRRFEGQRRSIHAVPEACRARPVVEYMP